MVVILIRVPWHYIEAALELKAKYGDSAEFSLSGFIDLNNPLSVSKQDM